MEPFIITLANGVQYMVTPAYFNGKDLTYRLSIGGVSSGSIIPFVEEYGLTWISDDIDPLTIDEIGKLIENNEE